MYPLDFSSMQSVCQALFNFWIELSLCVSSFMALLTCEQWGTLSVWASAKVDLCIIGGDISLNWGLHVNASLLLVSFFSIKTKLGKPLLHVLYTHSMLNMEFCVFKKYMGEWNNKIERCNYFYKSFIYQRMIFNVHGQRIKVHIYKFIRALVKFWSKLVLIVYLIKLLFPHME